MHMYVRGGREAFVFMCLEIVCCVLPLVGGERKKERKLEREFLRIPRDHTDLFNRSGNRGIQIHDVLCTNSMS